MSLMHLVHVIFGVSCKFLGEHIVLFSIMMQPISDFINLGYFVDDLPGFMARSSVFIKLMSFRQDSSPYSFVRNT